MIEFDIVVNGPEADDPVSIVDENGTVVAAFANIIDAIHAQQYLQPGADRLNEAPSSQQGARIHQDGYPAA